MRLSNASIKSMAALVLMAGYCAVAAAAAGDLPQVPGDNGAQYVPVARRPRAEVLARGDGRYLRPDLTRGQLNDYRELIAWILNIKFTDAQCDYNEQRMITRWPSLYGLDTDEITGASKQIADIKAMPPAELKVTYKSLHEQVLKNLRDMVGGASMIGMYKVVTEEDRKDAAWLLGVYEDQHPEEVAPMPQMPNVPGAAGPAQQNAPPPPPQQQQTPAAAAETPRGAAAPVDQTLAGGSTPLKKSATDAMCQVICFLAAKSRGGEYVPPGEAFQALFARKLAAEYPAYSAQQQAAFARIPQYWTQLHSNWDRMSMSDQNQTLASWKPLLDALQTASATAAAQPQNLSADDRAALASMTDQEAQTRAQLEQLRGMQQRDLNQQMQLARMEQMQRMQAEQIRMMSNIAASAHETNMTIIHNMGPTRHPWD